MVELLLLLGLLMGLPPVDDRTVNDSVSTTSGAPCDEDCAFHIPSARWLCVVGTVGNDSEELDGGHCSFTNCFGFAHLNASGAISGLALCEAEMESLVAYAESVGETTLIGEALRSGLIMSGVPRSRSADE